MKAKSIITALFLFLVFSCFGQEISKWDRLLWLTGDWKGEGGGQPGQGGGIFSFAFDLNKNIMVRKSHSEYGGNSNQQVSVHEDLMIIYSEPGSEPLKAVYFDNEGHIINYTLIYSGKAVVFQSKNQPDTPVFRLSYTPVDEKTVNIKFEMSRDGINYMTYIEGKSSKAK